MNLRPALDAGVDGGRACVTSHFHLILKLVVANIDTLAVIRNGRSFEPARVLSRRRSSYHKDEFRERPLSLRLSTYSKTVSRKEQPFSRRIRTDKDCGFNRSQPRHGLPTKLQCVPVLPGSALHGNAHTIDLLRSLYG